MDFRTRRLVLTSTALAALLLGGACSSGSDNATSESAVADGRADDATMRYAEDAPEAGAEADAANLRTESRDAVRQAVISTGTVALESDDVAGTRFAVQKVVDRYDGTVAEQETTTGDDGAMDTARMVLRVPAGRFAEVLGALEEVATVTGTTSGSEDVTTQVIDTAARLRAQERSLSRIEALLAEATDLRQVVAIERELTARQSELDSLTRQQAWLADQTSLSTITVHVERPDEASKDDDRTGFLGGLQRGWDGLLTGLGASLTVVGFLLPFAGLALLLGLPLWLALRARRTARTPSGA